MRTIALLVLLVGCGEDEEEELATESSVRIVFENFQPTIAKIVQAGLDAKGTATQGANIPAISLTGDVAGTATLTGTIAQSAGENEQLSLFVQLDGYSDTGNVTYQTDNTSDATKLSFGLSIANQPPDNSMAGNLDGTLTVSGDAEGTGVFALRAASDLEDNDADPALICTRVTGSVTVGDTSETVDFVLPSDLSALDAAQQTKCRELN